MNYFLTDEATKCLGVGRRVTDVSIAWLLSVSWTAALHINHPVSDSSWLVACRVVAFLMMLFACVKMVTHRHEVYLVTVTTMDRNPPISDPVFMWITMLAASVALASVDSLAQWFGMH